MDISHLKFSQGHTLRGAVGARRTHGARSSSTLQNDPTDVLFVQRLLNRRLHVLSHFHSIVEDGMCGPRTIAAIIEFQRRFVPGIQPDGRIDPGAATIAALAAKMASHRPSPVRLSVPRTHGVAAVSTNGSAPRTTPAAAHGSAFPPHVIAFLNANAKAGQTAAAAWNVPASVLLAQAAHESAWGKRVKANAYFGIKGKSPQGESTSFRTTEVVAGKAVKITDSFRAYKDFAEAADDYGRFLNKNQRYSACFKYSRDPMKFVETLAAAGYATDPAYASKIKNIIRKYGLTDYDR